MESNTPSIASETMTQADKIAAALRTKGPLPVAALSAATGISPNAVRTNLSRFPWRFLNIQEGQHVGRWALIAPAIRDEET